MSLIMLGRSIVVAAVAAIVLVVVIIIGCTVGGSIGRHGSSQVSFR